jgi:GT2 family glycosyltransferase
MESVATKSTTVNTSDKVAVIIPNWNGAAELPAAIESVLAQSFRNFTLIIVDNGSRDGSRAIIEQYAAKDARVRAIWRDKNYGFTGGVNPGFEWAIAHDYAFAAPFNNDAIADKDWLKWLVVFLQSNPNYGIATCKILHADGATIDSTGDMYTTWGLAYPRGRDESDSHSYDKLTDIFGASGGASLYRLETLKQIGLFDQDFFAYYEDVDVSFRAQLAGWKVGFVPQASVLHEQGTTSGRMTSGFTTYQTIKNLPWLLWKNVPLQLLPTMLPRFALAYLLFIGAAMQRRQFAAVIKGLGLSTALLPKKLAQRHYIQSQKTVSVAYIRSILTWDLPPNARRLRSLRHRWHSIRGRTT